MLIPPLSKLRNDSSVLLDIVVKKIHNGTINLTSRHFIQQSTLSYKTFVIRSHFYKYRICQYSYLDKYSNTIIMKKLKDERKTGKKKLN